MSEKRDHDWRIEFSLQRRPPATRSLGQPAQNRSGHYQACLRSADSWIHRQADWLDHMTPPASPQSCRGVSPARAAHLPPMSTISWPGLSAPLAIDKQNLPCELAANKPMSRDQSMVGSCLGCCAAIPWLRPTAQSKAKAAIRVIITVRQEFKSRLIYHDFHGVVYSDYKLVSVVGLVKKQLC